MPEKIDENRSVCPDVGPGEQIDDLQYKDLKIIQKAGTFRYGTDAVLLVNFAAESIRATRRITARLHSGDDSEKETADGVRRIAKNGGPVRFLDVGTGGGIVPILLSGKLGADQGRALYTGIEIQEEMCALAERSVALNGLEGVVEIIRGDIREGVLPKDTFDVVTMNPPYVRAGGGLLNDRSPVALSRHELNGTQAELIAASAALLRQHGRFYMVNRPGRLADAVTALRENKTEPSRLRFVHADLHSEPVMFLLESVKNGGNGLKVLPPLLIDEFEPLK